MAYDKQLTPKSKNLSEWYNKVVLEAELADYGPAKGTMIFRPYGYAIWELIQADLDRRIKAKGVENAYFPLFIPQGLLNKEKEHIEGFSPELAVVTVGGGEKLEEPLVVRPTSETIMYDSYAKWIQSYRDLPLMINQWNNVVRWEKRTYLFMRTSEFLWQEGHTAHASQKESAEMMEWGIKTYADVYREVLALPGIVGRKSESEKFAGAAMTMTYESLMPEGKALQSATSHDLGINFSESFDITFQDKDGSSKHVWQTSWGFSTRSMGGLIMAHGDDKGLRLPPNVAPIQVIIVPARTTDPVIEKAKALVDQLALLGIRVRFDSRDGETIGYKINKWELKGVPIRLELGPRELEEGKVTLVRRDTSEKQSVALKELDATITEVLEEIQQKLYLQAQQFLHDNIRAADTFDVFKEILSQHKGFIVAPWCEHADCEASIQEETKATTRCLEARARELDGVTCVHCDRPAKHRWHFAQAY